MSMRRWIVALALTTLVGCTPARTSVAPAGGSPPSTTPASPTPSGDGTSPVTPIRFVLHDTYLVGQTARVGIQNVGDRPYRYQLFYAACELRYFDEDGRRFIIPPGTHCDMIAFGTIAPGETKPLFTWKLDECVRDAWGCVRSKPLPPGTYTIAGRFKPERSGERVRASGSFELLAS